ncbi:MAG: 16S rRNA (cytosine(1402)-N(4))-methyltransferase RsmH [Oscillospiraceae bacterium]|jgi:16S rRNA (cytosine1402-N4)-methyltransferase|nr:16S rRNA (cytosine(1402)-N(4))-methyltransferase RsmH [Oscillospiraceae bacterium]
MSSGFDPAPAFTHEPVLLRESLEALAIKPDGLYVDATLGAGGHAAHIAQRLTTGRLFGIDRDPEALRRAVQTLAPFEGRVVLLHGDYRNLDSLLPDGTRPDGVLFDLGVSSPQFDDPARGFSYRYDTRLDMRMNPNDPISAYEVVNQWPPEELRRILWAYGEEEYAPLIAAALIRRRAEAPIETTGQLAELVTRALPPKARRRKGHPAKQCFQALRMAVNDELAGIREGLRAAIGLLKPGGRLAAISFHSVEDRAVKTTLAEAARGCTCPPDFPVCVCGKTPLIALVTRKPLTAAPAELEQNRRAHSAKLRVAEKI